MIEPVLDSIYRNVTLNHAVCSRETPHQTAFNTMQYPNSKYKRNNTFRYLKRTTQNHPLHIPDPDEQCIHHHHHRNSQLLNTLHHRIHNPKRTLSTPTYTVQKPINLSIQTHSIAHALATVQRITSPRIGYSSEGMSRSRDIPTPIHILPTSLTRPLRTMSMSMIPDTPSASTPRPPSLNPPNVNNTRGQSRPGTCQKRGQT